MLPTTKIQQRFWLPSPPSVNALFRNAVPGVDRKAGRVPTEEYARWERQAQQELLLQRPKRLEGRVTLAFFFGARSPLADCTNYVKAPEDLLVTMGVIEGDNAKVVQGIDRIAWVPNYVGMVVHVTPYRESEPLWLGFDEGVLGQVQASDPCKMGLHPRALGRMADLAAGRKTRGRPPKIRI